MRPVRLLVLSAAALLLAACAGAGEPPSSDEATGTAPRAYTLDEAQAADVDGPILVTGLLIDAGDGWKLCALIAESYPPQCAGASVTVVDLDPADHDLFEANGVRWAEGATLFGVLSGDTFTVTGPASAA